MSRKRPSDDVLADYAGGALTPGLSLLVASHLTFDAESRRRVAGFEAIGGVMLADEAPMEPPALNDVLERLNGQVASFAEATPDAADHGGSIVLDEGPRPVFPAPLRKELGVDAEGVAWKFRFPGVSEYELDGFDGEAVSLLRAKPGAPLLSHTHSGVETTLVLSGQLQDRDEVFGPGDVSIATDEDDHRPRIIGDQPCICLIVMSGELRFTGTFSRALNLLAE